MTEYSAHGQDPAPGRLSGKVAIVTGAGRGIGRAIALALGSAGAHVVAVARTAAEVDETVHLLTSGGSSGQSKVADVADRDAVQRLVDQTLDYPGKIDILVNCAGVQGPIGPLHENDPDAWLGTIQTNLFGTFLCCRAVLPSMIARRSGRIVNLSGGGATAARPNFSAYASSKAAVVRLTETLAEEVRQYDIAVNAVAPGAVNTRMLDQVIQAGQVAGEEALSSARRQMASGGTPPSLVASLIVFLASSDADGLTGKLIAAPHDPWSQWDGDQIADIMAAPWYTLRRLDAHTLSDLSSKVR